jgi:hypothetical protein
VERVFCQLPHPGRPAGQIITMSGIGKVEGQKQKQAKAEPP